MHEESANDELVHYLVFILMYANLTLTNLPVQTPTASQQPTPDYHLHVISNYALFERVRMYYGSETAAHTTSQ